MTHESNKSSKSRTRAMLQKKWSVTPLKDELSGNLSYEFIFPVGDGTMGSLELGNELSTGEMSRRLARRTTLLPKPGAEAFIQKLIGAASGKFVIKAGQPGWKRSPLSSDKAFVAFVTPGQIIGPVQRDDIQVEESAARDAPRAAVRVVRPAETGGGAVGMAKRPASAIVVPWTRTPPSD